MFLISCGEGGITDTIKGINEPALDTSITSSPNSATNSTSATFAFTSTKSGSVFDCALDGGAWVVCTSPKQYTGLGEGNHTFQVRATDADGKTDQTPASYPWLIDTTPPQALITGKPDSQTASTDVSFEFSALESGASFECALDTDVFTECSSPRSYSGLSESSHTFQLRATDAVGNMDPFPVVYEWRIDSAVIDTTPPNTIINSEPDNPTNRTEAEFSFSASETGSSFECSFDNGDWSACSSPMVYSSLVEGRHSFQVRALDTSGNKDISPANSIWVIDLSPPDTIVNNGPNNPTNSTTAIFRFSSTEINSSFECAVDSGTWIECTNPEQYTDITEGDHSFQVRATDAVGNLDESPASFSWQVDMVPPQTSLNSGPKNLTNQTSATFEFSANESNSTFQCSLDEAAFLDCISPKTYEGLVEGNHKFQVRGVDAAGNLDDTPAGPHLWSIDTTPPDTTITTAPASAISSTEVSFSFSADETDSTFECNIDGGAYVVCISPVNYTGLTNGSHNFSVRAIDSVGNTDKTPASHDWVIDTVPPVITAPIDITIIISDGSGLAVTDSRIQTFLNSATATDNDSDLTASISNNAPDNFPMGKTTVTFEVSDAVGNVGSATAIVEVSNVDNEAPKFASIAINRNAEYAIVTSEFTARLKATDNVGITAYLITEHNATDSANLQPPVLEPLLSDSRWESLTSTTNLVTSVQFPLSNSYKVGDVVQLCVWFKDSQGNISENSCDATIYSVIYSETWENGWGNWYASNGIWQVGEVSAGPSECYSDSQCAGTKLDGNYADNSSSRLVSPSFRLPSISVTEEIQLRFQQWSLIGSWDAARVQVSYETEPRTWSAWETIASYSTSSGDWAHPLLDLSAYAGKKIRLGFLLEQSNSGWPNYSTAVASGWYVDNIVVTVESAVAYDVNASDSYMADFETGWDDWYAHNGIWETGIPTAGPTNCFDDSNGCMATELDGNYPNNASSRLISPYIQLPEITVEEEIQLRFQQWALIGSWDVARVQVSYETEPRTWSAWETIASYSTSSGDWAHPLLDLSAYAGKKIRLGFLLSQSNSGWPNYSTAVSSGWYVDNVVVSVESAVAYDVNASDSYIADFETGWDEWYAHNGIWETGIPTAGPMNCFNNSNGCTATELDGDYPNNAASRPTSPYIQLPEIAADEEIWLRFQQWVLIGSWDAARVQVSYETEPRTWSAWETIVSYSTSSGDWAYPLLDLSTYAGKKIRLGFLLEQGNSGWPNYSTAVSSGWYIDDIIISKF